MIRIKFQEFILQVIAALLVFVSVLLVIFGLTGGLSEVPFWDSWGGYLGFLRALDAGDYARWWGQHNEHRIVLTRGIFWVAGRFFAGSNQFLVTVNLILLISLVGALIWILRDAARRERIRVSQVLVFGAFLSIWTTSWVQHENLLWAFQSQFFLVQLVPLVSFIFFSYFLYPVRTRRELWPYGFLSIFFGLLSLGTMANGVLVLPVLFLLSVFSKCHRKHIFYVGAATVVSLFVYFRGYESVGHHGSVLRTVTENPLKVLEYIVTYLGGPFYHLFDFAPWTLSFAKLMGVVLIMFAMGFCVLQLRLVFFRITDAGQKMWRWAPLGYLIFIGGSVFVTAGGRAVFGVEQALSSRYSTPALVAWACVGLLVFPVVVQTRVKLLRWFASAIVICLSFVVLRFQTRALRVDSDLLFEREVSALALLFRVNDPAQVGWVSPSVLEAQALADYAFRKGLSLFGSDHFIWLKQGLGSIDSDSISTVGEHGVGVLESVRHIEGEEGFSAVSGWYVCTKKSENFSVPPTRKYLRILDESTGEVLGGAIVGATRLDVQEEPRALAIKSGFKGYVRKKIDLPGTSLLAIGKSGDCNIRLKIAAGRS